MRAALLILLAAASPLAAQVEAEPVLRGRVRLGGAAGPGVPEGVEEETVTLHRVSPDTAGEIDSTRAGPDGGFSFRLPSVPDPGGRGDIYFASVEHQGILYFGEPISTAIQLDSLYLIEVHDTVGAPAGGARLPVAIRYLVLEEAEAPPGAPAEDGGGWRITDLIQVRNPRDRTLVAVEGGPVWTYPLPPEASQVQVGGGEVGPDASRVAEGRLVTEAPLPPGERQFILRYQLESPEVTIPMPGTTESIELLVREPAPPLRVEGLEAAQPVEMQAGVTYRRYAATGLTDATVQVTEGEERGGVEVSPRWVAVLIALLLGAAGIWFAVRPRPRSGRAARAEEEGFAAAGGAASAGAVDEPEARRAMLLEVARIDEALEEGGVDADEAAAMRARRSDLLARLKARG